MATSRDNLNADERSFWSLVENSIRVPDIQRDYSYGREDDEIKRIRNELIRSIIDAVENESLLNLNFIYGSLSNDEFMPVDGQQRLTTLYLFHWYIMLRCNKLNYNNRLDKFTYATRDTSKRFTERLNSIPQIEIDSLYENPIKEYDFAKESISEQIRNKPWFTGTFSNDPTIVSMLNVLDAIHVELCDKSSDFFEKAYENFVNDKECHIKFLLLPLSGYDEKAAEDLYIKLNARGKLLTDMEIFKGLLQKSDVFKSYAKALIPNDNTINDVEIEKKIIECISEINNEYSEMFHQFSVTLLSQHEDTTASLLKFDKLMMKFINEFCRYEYFLNLLNTTSSISNEMRRKEIIGFSSLSVVVFWKQMEAVENLETIISRLFMLFRNLMNNYKEIITDTIVAQRSDKEYFNNNILLNVQESSYFTNTIRYLSYCYLIKNELIDDRFLLFKRFIYNVVKNAGSQFDKNPDVPIRLANFISEEISMKGDILYEISNLQMPYEHVDTIEAIVQQLDEEVEKASLMLNNTIWNDKILKAEEYFIDGQIGFLLELCKANDKCNIDQFVDYFELSSILFTREKNLQNSINGVLFRQALLYMVDNTKDKTSYLMPANIGTDSCWCFIKDVDESFKELLRGAETRECSIKREILLNLLIELNTYKPKSSDDANNALKKIIEKRQENYITDAMWKDCFLDNDIGLFSSDWWAENNRCIFIGKNGLVLLLSGLKTSSYNIDIKTYIAGIKLKATDSLIWQTTGELKDENGIYRRYLDVGDIKIAYDYEEKSYYKLQNRGKWEKADEADLFATAT